MGAEVAIAGAVAGEMFAGTTVAATMATEAAIIGGVEAGMMGGLAAEGAGGAAFGALEGMGGEALAGEALGGEMLAAEGMIEGGTSAAMESGLGLGGEIAGASESLTAPSDFLAQTSGDLGSFNNATGAVDGSVATANQGMSLPAQPLQKPSSWLDEALKWGKDNKDWLKAGAEVGKSVFAPTEADKAREKFKSQMEYDEFMRRHISGAQPTVGGLGASGNQSLARPGGAPVFRQGTGFLSRV